MTAIVYYILPNEVYMNYPGSEESKESGPRRPGFDIPPGSGCFAVEWVKSEIRISKSEANPKFE